MGDKVLRDLKTPAGASIHSRVLSSMSALADFLVSEVRGLERGSEGVKKEVKDQIPSDRIKDAAAMARELRWRVRLATGYPSDNEGKASNRNKRKRSESGSPAAQEEGGAFRNFKPKTWDRVVEKRTEEEARAERWVESGEEEGEGVEASVCRRRELVVKVRKTATGVERQQIERVVEHWTYI